MPARPTPAPPSSAAAAAIGNPAAARPSLKTVAQAARVSVATVSLALRNSPRCAARTRALVARVAARLGYTPDPQIAKLMSYLHRPAGGHGGAPLPLAITRLNLDWPRFATVAIGFSLQEPHVHRVAHDHFAGIDQHSHRIGEAAVKQLVAALHQNETGLPHLPATTLVRGEWVEGRSLPPTSRVRPPRVAIGKLWAEVSHRVEARGATSPTRTEASR